MTAATLQLARQYHQAGDYGQAEDICRQLLEVDPTNAEALSVLGSTLMNRGRLRDAIPSFRQALRFAPDSLDALFALGNALQQQGDLEGAAGCFRACVRLGPECTAAWYNFGNILQSLGRLEEAAHAYREALRVQPDFAEAHHNLGSVLVKAGRFDEAIGSYERAIRLKPDYAEAHKNLGTALVRAGRRLEDAANAYREALRLRPDSAEVHRRLGNVLQKLYYFDHAVKHYEKALQLRPDDVEALCSLGAWCLARNQELAAIDHSRRALHINPGFAPAHMILGEAYLDRGEPEKACAHFREVLRLEPRSLEALSILATNGLYSADEPGVERLTAWLAEPHLRPGEASTIHFILGRLLDRAGSHRQAFEHFRAGYARRRQEESGNSSFSFIFDLSEQERWFNRSIGLFSREYFERVRGWGLDVELPVFIVGMGRSGTTLVEQILSCHPQVVGAGELDDVFRTALALPGLLHVTKPYPDCMEHVEAAAVRNLADAHLERLVRLAGTAERVVDKFPLNFIFLGLIATLFPRARVIHCRRNPRDQCLSCFLNHFADLEELGRYYRRYKRLMDHFQAVIPSPILDVDYEELVTDVEAVSRRLIAFCGLEWDDRCLRFFENHRPVHTPSRLQVRRPVYTQSVGRWREYGALLEPLLRALGDAVPDC